MSFEDSAIAPSVDEPSKWAFLSIPIWIDFVK